MRFSTLVVVGLLHFVGSAQGFSGVSGARFVSQRPRVLPGARGTLSWHRVPGAARASSCGHQLPLVLRVKRLL